MTDRTIDASASVTIGWFGWNIDPALLEWLSTGRIRLTRIAGQQVIFDAAFSEITKVQYLQGYAKFFTGGAEYRMTFLAPGVGSEPIRTYFPPPNIRSWMDALRGQGIQVEQGWGMVPATRTTARILLLALGIPAALLILAVNVVVIVFMLTAVLSAIDHAR